MTLDGALDDQGIYYYVTDGHTGKLFLHVVLKCVPSTHNRALFIEDLSQAVDLEVIKERSNVHSETTDTRNNFPRRTSQNVMCVVCSQDWKRNLDMGCISSPMGGALRWAQNSIIPLM